MLVTTSLSKPYRKCQSEPTGDTEARRKRVAKALEAKRQAESTQEADARRKKEAEAQATKHQPETPQNVEKRRQQGSQDKKRYIALLCIYMIPLLMPPLSNQEA